MTERNVRLKKIDSNVQQQVVNDALTCVIEMYYNADTLKALKDKKLSEVKADKVLAFNKMSDNSHRLFKQMRSFQRAALNIYYNVRSDLTHYAHDMRKLHVAKFNATEKCNRYRVFHLYSIEDDEAFEEIKEIVKAL